MSRFLALVLAWLCLSSAVYAQQTSSTVPNPIPGAQGGTGGTTYVTLSNANGAGVTNSALIQANLTLGYHTIIECQGVVHIATKIKIPSGGNLELPASGVCVPTADANTGTMVENAQAEAAWTVTQLNSSGAVGPLSMIWSGSTPAWVTSTVETNGSTAAAPIYNTNAGNIYWLTNTSTCTTGGTPPTGTGTGISDGGCTWNYVTANQVTPNSTLMGVAVYYPSHGLTAGQALWVTPQPDGAAPGAWAQSTAYLPTQEKTANGNIYVEKATSCTSLGSGTGPSGTGSSIADNTCTWAYISASANYTYLWSGAETGQGVAGGLADSAYFGVFPIYAVNDSNWVTVLLRRQPATAFSGIPMLVKQADQNITIRGGGTWNYNYPTNAGSGVQQGNVSAEMMVMAGVQNLTIDGVTCQAAQKFCLQLNGVNNATIRGFNGSNLGTNSDRIKIYGPAFDVSVENSSGMAVDDILSIQTQDVPPFGAQTLASGDIINIHIKNLLADGGLAFTTYINHPYLVTDQIFAEGIDVRNTNATARAPIAIYNSALVGTPAMTLGLWKLTGATISSSGQCLVEAYNLNNNTGGLTAQSITLDSVESNWHQSGTLNASATGCLFDDAANSFPVSLLVLQNVRDELQSSLYAAGTDTAIHLLSSTISNLVVRNSYFVGSSSGTNIGMVLYDGASSGTVTHAVFEGNYFTNLSAIGRVYEADDIVLRDNFITNASNGQGIGINLAGVKVHICGNYFNNTGFGVVRYNGVFTATVISCGDNTLAGTSIMIGNPGAANANIAGSTFVNLVDLMAITVPTLSNCGATTTPVAGSTELAGTALLPTAQLSCQINFTSNTVPVPPKNCYFVAPQSTIISGGCTVSWTSATSGFITLGVSANVAGETVGYGVSP